MFFAAVAVAKAVSAATLAVLAASIRPYMVANSVVCSAKAASSFTIMAYWAVISTPYAVTAEAEVVLAAVAAVTAASIVVSAVLAALTMAV